MPENFSWKSNVPAGSAKELLDRSGARGIASRPAAYRCERHISPAVDWLTAARGFSHCNIDWRGANLHEIFNPTAMVKDQLVILRYARRPLSTDVEVFDVR